MKIPQSEVRKFALRPVSLKFPRQFYAGTNAQNVYSAGLRSNTCGSNDNQPQSDRAVSGP